MTAFEYLSVLLSIILGLAITQVLQGYRSLLLSRRAVVVHWPPLIWSGLVLLFATQAWWASFGLESQREWRFGTFLVILVQMGLIYMLAAMVLPDVADGVEVDLRAHFEAQRKPFFVCLIGIVVVSLAKDLMLDGRLPSGPNLLFHGLLAATAVAGLVLRGIRAQFGIAIVAGLFFSAYVALLFTRF